MDSEPTHWEVERGKIVYLQTLMHCLKLSIIIGLLQVGLRARFYHSATAVSLCPGLTEVTLFGGCPEWPSNFKTDADFPRVANTAVLRFGEFLHTICSPMWHHTELCYTHT